MICVLKDCQEVTLAVTHVLKHQESLHKMGESKWENLLGGFKVWQKIIIARKHELWVLYSIKLLQTSGVDVLTAPSTSIVISAPK